MNLGTIAVVAEGEYNPLKAYKKLRLVSLEGSSYYTLMATNPGESPVSHPEKWMVSGLKGEAISDPLKFDKTGGKIAGRTSIGADLLAHQLLNFYDNFKMLNDENKAIIIGDTENTAGAIHRVYHEDMSWTVPTGNAGMIGDYADLYLHQIETAPSTVAANESYTNISTSLGVENLGRQLGYLGGVMIMSGNKGLIGQISGAQIVNRIRDGASGNIGSMAGVQGGLSTYGVNDVKIYEFRALESFTEELQGGEIRFNYGLYLREANVTGVEFPFGVYQKGYNDLNYFEGKVRIGFGFDSTITQSPYHLEVDGSAYLREINASQMQCNGTFVINRVDSNTELDYSFRVNEGLRFIQNFSEEETGNNEGSNIYFYRYNDDGNYLGMVYSINRATGTFEIGEELKAKTVKLKTVTLNPTPEPGTLEFDGADLYFTNGAGVRTKIN